jgi:hypothetical protein
VSIEKNTLTAVRQVAERLAAALEPAASALNAARDGAAAMQHARDLETLLHASGADLNKRAALILTCRRGAAAYRVFEIPGYGPLGVAAHEPPIGSGMDEWRRFADWISRRPRPGTTHGGRCRCCRRPLEISEQRIVDLLAARRRRAPAVVQ